MAGFSWPPVGDLENFLNKKLSRSRLVEWALREDEQMDEDFAIVGLAVTGDIFRLDMLTLALDLAEEVILEREKLVDAEILAILG